MVSHNLLLRLRLLKNSILIDAYILYAFKMPFFAFRRSTHIKSAISRRSEYPLWYIYVYVNPSKFYFSSVCPFKVEKGERKDRVDLIVKYFKEINHLPDAQKWKLIMKYPTARAGILQPIFVKVEMVTYIQSFTGYTEKKNFNKISNWKKTKNFQGRAGNL